MQYSIARYRSQRPAPPFGLSGEFRRINGQVFIGDALGLVPLVGEVFESLMDGDLASVTVVAQEGENLRCVETHLVHRSAITEPRQVSSHASEFVKFVQDVRRYFLFNGLSELQTPTLVECPGLEPTLEPFATKWTRGREEKTLFLPTSPEIHLKKAMALGFFDVFEIKPCFRRGEFSSHHLNEFTMLEWYRGFADLDVVIADLISLLSYLGEGGWGGGSEVRFTDFAELFREHLQFELKPSTSRDELWNLLGVRGMDRHDSDTFTDLFHRLMIEVIEPALTQGGPTVVRRFPPEMAALAKLDADGWADRFEFYWNGLEIANAFYEVTDPDEQRSRWNYEQSERARLGTTALPQDEGLIVALERGLPPTGGIALGLERLYMAFTGVRDIQQLKLFTPN